jgi:hypothetical protein
MPSIAFVNPLIVFHHEIPTGVSVLVTSETPLFDITFTIGGVPACYLLDSAGQHQPSITFNNVNAMSLNTPVYHTFPLSAGVEGNPPPGSTMTTLTAVVTNALGQSMPAITQAQILVP